MAGTSTLNDLSTRSSRQRDALWKWRWLGLRDSTPAFKACLVLLAAVAFALAVYSQVPVS
jgi:hypothetical protein